ncbi:phage tail protein [Salmonella enterica]|nr:phage tail protein [Salmonella enterica]HDH8994222.1 phage tail protein [Salmonella enterica subsp. enterica serovar Enteritidis]EBB9499214.1 phage tail protein [Salmonella enterica]EBC3607178.1 phage tail protein [Salmonella enterica]EEN2512361.1 phage tail protein [Salmonella enterica]
MSTKFKTIITTAGAAKLAAATLPGGKKVNITVMAVGDGGGSLPEPNASQTKLINEVWRHALNKISQDNRNSNYIVAELVIPPEVGGFWMRELGLYDDEGILIAVANMAESYKPELAEGSGRAQTCRMVIIVSNIASVELSIDSTMVMATQDYVDDKLAEHEKSRRHPDATLREKGFTQLSSATDSASEELAATPKAVKAAYDLADGKYTAQDATTTRKGLVQLSNATDSTSETLAATPKAVKVAYDLANAKYTAQDATTARKGIIQLSNATDSTSETLAATPKAVKAAMDNANGRLEKNSNGGDIPDKAKFVENLGLKETLNPTKRVSIGNIGTGVFDGSTPCINIGDSDSGFIGSADGVLDIYCNGAKVGYINGNGLHMLTDIHFDNARMTTNGDIFSSVWGDNWLSIWITNQLNTRGTIDWINSELAIRDNNINTRATIDYVNQTFARKNTGSIQDWGWILDDSTGFIMQWGTLGNSNGTYNFPRAFPVGCFAVFVTNTNAQGTQVDNAFGYPVSNSQFFAATKSSGMANLVNNFPVAWFAIGR